ncbi:MAG: (deoxy)nucleoside triphosphate pyrophosphohydrolase [Thermodesulfobacteriota bacterium]
MLEVVAAVIERQGRYLLCQRPLGKHHGGLWEFPGGKVRPGESHPDALARELQEELSLAVGDNPRLLARIADGELHISFFALSVHGEPYLHEHSALAWVSPADLPAYPLAPCDARFARDHSRLLSRGA